MKKEYKLKEFVCIYCGKELENGAKNLKLYCNGSCEYHYNKSTTPEDRVKNRKILEKGRLRRIQTQEFQCAYCNEIFTALTHQKRQYCCHACHNKAQIEYFAAIDAQKLTEVVERVRKLATSPSATNLYRNSSRNLCMNIQLERVQLL